jgi:prevent-host-death family protein
VLAKKAGRTVNMHEAKTRLSELVEAAERGERIVIARNGEPAVVLVPAAKGKRAPAGIYRGRLRIGEDFDAPLPPEFSGVDTP